MTQEIPPLDKNNRRSDIWCCDEFVLFEPLFGYRQYVSLPDSKRKIFNLSDLESADLGKNVRDVLANSRILDLSEVDDFFDDDRLEKCLKESNEIILKMSHKKNESAFYKNMMNVPTALDDGIISFCPLKHDRSGCYSGFRPGPGHVKIPLSSSDEEIGRALKLAFSRCTGVGAFEFHKKLRELGWE